nr:MAG TPA: hypothetical protein [Caudoviricetes sp.]
MEIAIGQKCLKVVSTSFFCSIHHSCYIFTNKPTGR